MVHDAVASLVSFSLRMPHHNNRFNNSQCYVGDFAHSFFDRINGIKKVKAKDKNLFTRNRKGLCIVLAILLYLCLLAADRHYRHYKLVKNNPVSVYDLTWVDRTDADNVVYRRWRYYIENKTKLPRKIKKYSRLDPNDSYVLEETVTVSYPTNEEVMQVIKDAGSGDLAEGNFNVKGTKDNN